jgi:cell division protein FtsA
MGKGTTDMLLYGNGSMVMTDSIKLGGESVDTDISKVLHTPVNYAEEMKKKHARADYNIMIQEKQQSAPENIDVFDLSGKISSTVTSERLSQIVYARIFQIFGDYIKKSVEKASILQGRTYAIILSGGQARQNGINELVQSIFNIPVRTGLPRGLLNLDKAYQFPEFTSAIGTVLLASRNERKKTKQGIGKKIEDLWGKIKRNF